MLEQGVRRIGGHKDVVCAAREERKMEQTTHSTIKHIHLTLQIPVTIHASPSLFSFMKLAEHEVPEWAISYPMIHRDLRPKSASDPKMTQRTSLADFSEISGHCTFCLLNVIQQSYHLIAMASKRPGWVVKDLADILGFGKSA
jgi:hypothetical protein